MLQDSPETGVLYISFQLLFVKFDNLIYRHGTYHDKFGFKEHTNLTFIV